MSHLDPEQLALIALGEPLEDHEQTEHLASCPACAGEVSEMIRVTAIARSTIDDGELEAPPERVWARIADELLLEPPAPTATPPLSDIAPAQPDAAASPPRRPRRAGWRTAWVLAASLAGIAVVGAGTWGVVNVRMAPTSIATAALDPFPDHPDSVGSAAVERDRDGARFLTVSLDRADEPDSYREVWLIRNDGQALVSLGVLTGETGRFDIPSGIDLADYDLVDISFEPLDGDPAHSGDSIVRGQLTFA